MPCCECGYILWPVSEVFDLHGTRATRNDPNLSGFASKDSMYGYNGNDSLFGNAGDDY